MAGDVYWGNTTLLLHCDDSSFTDSSTAGHSYSSISGVSLNTSNALFGAGAAYFDGTGTGLSFAHSDDFNLATGDFFIEIAAEFPSLGNFCLFQKDQHYGSTFTSYSLFLKSDGSLTLSVGTGNTNTSAQDVSTSASVVTSGSYHRIAAGRYGSLLLIFVDGTLVQSVAQTASPQDGGSPLVFGYFPSGGTNNDWKLVAYVDEIRITKGVARKTAGYTVDSVAFPNSAAMFSGTILDASGSPVVRTVKAIRRDTGAFIASATSNSSGVYSLTTNYAGEHDLICLDSSGSLPDLILSRVTPV